MKGALHFLAKELVEIRRTWRLPTVGGVLLFFAVMSPLAALATPALVASVTASQPGVVIELPDPTYLDSYAQWIKNLSQIGLVLVVFASAGLLAGERASGTAALVASKPVSRAWVTVAKFVAQAGLVIVATALGTAVTYVGTLLAFGEAPAGILVASSAAWGAGAVMAVAVTLVYSAVAPTLTAGVLGLVTFGIAGVAGMWRPVSEFTAIGLLAAPGKLLAGEPVSLVLPVVTGTLLTVGLVLLAGWLFSRREL